MTQTTAGRDNALLKRASAASDELDVSRQRLLQLQEGLRARAHHSAGWLLPVAGLAIGVLLAQGTRSHLAQTAFAAARWIRRLVRPQ